MSLSETRPSDRTAAAVQIKGWRVGELVLDTVLMRVLRDGVPLAIDRRGIDLLFHLAENAGRTVSKDALIAVAWPGRVVSENSLVKAISKLRQALGDGDGDCLQVVHGYGYRLVCVVESLAAVHEAIREPAVETPAGHAEAVANQSRHWLHAGGLLLVLLGLLWAVVLLTDIETKDRTATDASRTYDVVAFLPLRDASANGGLALYADGLSNYLRDQFGSVPALRMIHRAESQRYRGDRRPPGDLARELGADLLVTGEVSQVEGQLRVDLQLFDARGRIPPWRQIFQRLPGDQATLFEDIKGALLAAIADQKGRWGHDQSSRRGTTNDAAYQAFLRAATLFSGNNDPNNQRRAIVLLQRAVELDPNYADALLTLGGIYGGSGYYADTVDELLEGRKRAIASMDRGIELAPDDPANYLLRSEMQLLYLFDVEAAWADLRAAADRTPDGESARLLVWHARLLASLGRIDEAIETGARAIALDPAAGARRNQGWHYLAKGDTRNARAVLMLQLVDLPENPHTNFYLALCDIYEGQPEAALQRLELSSTLFRLLGTVIAQHERGDHAASDIALQKLIDQFAIPDGYWIGAAYAWRGELDQAFHWIERAIEGGDSSAAYLLFDPLLANLRDDPRYQRLVDRVGLGEPLGRKS
ncbi:MAG: Transcriptional activator CadC [Alphaproteobacteria bacterium ADurb.BinA280]|nr:MAG: Transcriptional activator CadC [Alphaproteobacteria bacterium ADurb.BinA280]